MIKDHYRIREKPGTYIHYANMAAQHERKGEYQDAADLWDRAANRALNGKNRDYAKARHRHCTKALEEAKAAA